MQYNHKSNALATRRWLESEEGKKAIQNALKESRNAKPVYAWDKDHNLCPNGLQVPYTLSDGEG